MKKSTNQKALHPYNETQEKHIYEASFL